MGRPNPKSSGRDMVLSMAVLLVPLLVILWFFTNDPEAQPEAIDLAQHVEIAAEESDYPVLVAERLPAGWVPVQASWASDGEPWMGTGRAAGDSWMAGWLGPDGIHYAVYQRDVGGDTLVSQVTRDGQVVDGTVHASGLDWQRYESEDGRTRALVAQGEGFTAIVAADTNFEALEAFATSLDRI